MPGWPAPGDEEIIIPHFFDAANFLSFRANHRHAGSQLRPPIDPLLLLHPLGAGLGPVPASLGPHDAQVTVDVDDAGRAIGDVDGKEPLALHDARLQLALASLKLKPWPFPGAVGIREPGPGDEAPVLHVIDRWQHLGTARDSGEIEALVGARSLDGFDADSYRIIGRCLERLDRRQLVMIERRG